MKNINKIILTTYFFAVTFVVKAQMTGGGPSSSSRGASNIDGNLQDYYGKVLVCYDILQVGVARVDNVLGMYAGQSLGVLKVFKNVIAIGGGVGCHFYAIYYYNNYYNFYDSNELRYPFTDVHKFVGIPIYLQTRFFPLKKLYIDTKFGICPVPVAPESVTTKYGSFGFGYSTSKISLGLEYQAGLFHFAGFRLGFNL